MKQQSIKPSAEFMTLLPVFTKRFIHGRVNDFDWQCWKKGDYKWINGQRERKIGYENQKRALTQVDIIKHFYENERDKGDRLHASLSLSGIFNGIVKVVSIDIDNEEQLEVWTSRLRPLLIEKDIDFFIEWGGDVNSEGSYSRCHVLIFLDALPYDTAKNFIRTIFFEIDEPIFNNEVKHFDRYERTRILFDEIFPINKPNNNIRPPGGYHMRRGARYPCQYKDDLLDTPEKILAGLKQCRVVGLDQANSIIKSDVCVLLDSQKMKGNDNSNSTFYYEPINLPLPVNNVPPKLVPLVKNCKAVNTIITDIVKHDKINKPGDMQHETGWFLSALLSYHDKVFKNDLGRQFFSYLLEQYREKPEGDHNWTYYGLEKAYSLKCESWDSKFGLCDGCPYSHLITNPIKLIPVQHRDSKGELKMIDNIPITKNLVGKMKLATYDDIRQNEFPVIEDYIVGLVLND